MITPPSSGFVKFLETKCKKKDRISKSLNMTHLDMTHYVSCDPKIKHLCMYHSQMNCKTSVSQGMLAEMKGNFGLIHNGSACHQVFALL